MSLLKISIDGQGSCAAAGLAEALDRLPPGAPVVLLIHGYKFSPSIPFADPHRHILSLHPVRGCWKALSWPRHLGFGRGHRAEGLCIACGWEARGSIWQAWRSAEQAGLALTRVARMVQAKAGRPLHVIAHSLGARVALSLLQAAPGGSMGRVILLAAGAYRSQAQSALAAPAGAASEIINITSRENDLFDAALERLVPSDTPGDVTLGLGLGGPAPNWVDIQVDDDATRAALAAMGHPVPAPLGRICHWWAYLRPGLLRFYCDLIRAPEVYAISRLRAHLPSGQAPRWSRLLRRPWRTRRHLPRLTPRRGLLGG